MPGQYIYPRSSNFTGGTVPGETVFTSGITASTISSDIFFVSGTSLDNYIQSIVNLSTFTGGTVSGATQFTNDLTATTIYSGSTLLDSLFARTSHTHAINEIVDLQTRLLNKAELSGATFTGDVLAPLVNANSIYSASTLIDSLFARTIHTHDISDVNGLQTVIDGKADLTGATFTGGVTATGITITSLTDGRILFTNGGIISDNANLLFDTNTNILSSYNILTSGLTVGTDGAIIEGSLNVYGQSAFTNNLYVGDKNVTINYNPSGSSESTSLGSGLIINDGLGISGTTAFFDLRGSSIGSSNRSFTTNLEDIRIRETGTIGAPNGKRLLAEEDLLDGGQF